MDQTLVHYVGRVRLGFQFSRAYCIENCGLLYDVLLLTHA